MSKEEILKLKMEIYETIYSAITYEDPTYICRAKEKIEAQLEILEEVKDGKRN